MRITACAARSAAKAGLPASLHACEELRAHLIALVGHSGCRALLTRALALAGTDVAWLQELQLKPDGGLQGLDELTARYPQAEIADGGLALLSHLLELLMAFIGEGLTLRLVAEVWPKISLKDLAAGGD